MVESPIIMEQPVPISAAHRPERVIPPSMGGTLIKIIGSAMAAEASGRSALLATPKIAHIKPTGTISKAPKMKPFLAALSSFPVRPICTTPWTEFVLPSMTIIQLIMPIQPIPAVKLR